MKLHVGDSLAPDALPISYDISFIRRKQQHLIQLVTPGLDVGPCRRDIDVEQSLGRRGERPCTGPRRPARPLLARRGLVLFTISDRSTTVPAISIVCASIPVQTFEDLKTARISESAG